MNSRNAKKEQRDVAVQTDEVESDAYDDGMSEEMSDDESLLDEHDLLVQNGRENPENNILPDGVTEGFRSLVDKIGKPTAKKFLDIVKSQKAFHRLQGCRLKLDITGKGRVNLYQLNAGQPKTPIVRMDIPHANVPFNHLNINPKVSGMPTDPHLKLPSGAMPVGRGAARAVKALNRANKVLLPLAVAVDVARTGYAVSQDIKNKSSRNTVETVASIAGGWAGGFGGAAAGATVGSLIFPGIGTIAGGLIGAFSGGLGCAAGSTALVNQIGDACDYDIIKKLCATCRCLFYIRVYDGESRDWKYCVDCRETADKATQCPDAKDDNSEANDDEDYDKVHDRVD